ncbi:evolutionarily conserved signaling intermediate in Toll pathway, mitochondrial [Toxorhynchites rutilus septentrionalis]|uniref:evolutionarily conserved signaling intermediate in Toll pathway, mitochondrial n=1 Tax=Toxorhynchites rutilus septentrionalis TaxID=329112 RepID=UPI002479C654|nr:evolutionarily conserved signaling intermediate in Toll pathway, mitochondrial [Toxorhynchites rutilus septentrionalis]
MMLIRQRIGTVYLLSRTSFRACTSNSNGDDAGKGPKTGSSDTKLVVRTQFFEHVSQKDKKTYIEMVRVFEDRSVHRRNHVEFIYAALKHMEEFGVQRDLEVYKALINVMPKGKFIPTNIFQAEFMHYPRQQQVIIDLLEQMEDNGVIPDYEMESMLINVFGKKGHPVRKYWRMMYWMPKFKNLSPWPLPNPVPNDSLELARMAVERMCTVDLLSEITLFDTKDVPDAVDQTWIVSGQSSEQTGLLARHKLKPVFIEGPFVIWLRNRSINYFLLKSESNPPPPEDERDFDDVRNIRIPFLGIGISHRMESSKNKVGFKRSVHEQDDGTIFAICCTGSSTKDSLLSWVRLLQKHGNPYLAQMPVLFRFTSPVPDQLKVAAPDDSEEISA